MKVFERICLRDWHVEAQNGDRQDCIKGQKYTTSAPREDGTVLVFSSFWVRAPDSIFEPLPGGDENARLRAELATSWDTIEALKNQGVLYKEERDRLRELLREARPIIVESQTFDGHTTDTPSGLIGRISAALKEG